MPKVGCIPATWPRCGKTGYFRITGRLKEMIIRGGENIYPREIEEFLHRHPKVADVYVVGLPDERLGEKVLAWVRVLPGETATEEEIRDYCRGRIAHFKIPEYIRFVDEFPMTVTGKVQKFIIREREIEMRKLGGVAQGGDGVGPVLYKPVESPAEHLPIMRTVV